MNTREVEYIMSYNLVKVGNFNSDDYVYFMLDNENVYQICSSAHFNLYINNSSTIRSIMVKNKVYMNRLNYTKEIKMMLAQYISGDDAIKYDACDKITFGAILDKLNVKVIPNL